MGLSSFFNYVTVLILLSVIVTLVHGQGTRVGFYSSKCPQVEDIVRETVQSHFRSDPTVAPGLLRMHFHDCFVRGCDGSNLIDGPDTEKTALPNLSLRGFEAINDAKTRLEAACPGIVSCADILALAAKDSVALTGGLPWPVPLGRRDGTVSQSSDTASLPGFTDSVDDRIQKYEALGLNTQDLVVLYGGHTIGSTACQFFSYRLYNFNGNGADPSIDPTFVQQLQALCPENGDGSRRVELDIGSNRTFDNSYFTNLRRGRGILESDQSLYTDNRTRKIVDGFTGVNGFLGLNFKVEFGRSMVKMSNIGVKTGTNGEIRRVCSAIN